MSAPRVTSVVDGSPADAAGIRAGDELLSINGVVPRDVLEYSQLLDTQKVTIELRRGPSTETVTGCGGEEPFGVEIASPVFDRIRTCDNHCAFCFIYQLPKGMRRSLYVKDDDYRLSFLYGNFTTLTRFTELDAERVIDERLSPMYVSIHATNPEIRASMLRNPKGATSLRWLRILLDAGIEIHGQVVVCPGINDGAVLEDTMAGIVDEYADLASVGVVPLGISDHSHEATMRTHTKSEAIAVVDTVTRWQEVFLSILGRRMVYAADEYYLLTTRPFPAVSSYDGFPQLENGIGMAREFAASFRGADPHHSSKGGFFASVDGAPAAGYRAPRMAPSPCPVEDRGTTILTGAYGAQVLGPLLADHPAEVLAVENRFFGGNIGVTGLLTGTDLSRALSDADPSRRYLLPDVCLSGDQFLDGTSVDDLPLPVEVIKTEGAALARALGVAS